MIKFYRGLKKSYSEQHYNGIYFATDTGEILHGGKSYSGVDLTKSVTDVTLTDGVLSITYSDGTTSTIEMSSGKYKSNIEDKNLAMPNAVGGISKNTKLSELEGKTYDSILDDLLFPTVYPTYTAPSASITLKNYNAIQEVGSKAPTVDNFTTGYNPGQISINGVKQANRGGDIKDSYITYGQTNTTLPITIIEDSVEYVYHVVYNTGPQPKDNKGNNYGSPLSEGTVTNSVSVNGTYPWFATTNIQGQLTKQALVAWSSSMVAGGTSGFELLPHTSQYPQQFKMPRQATKLQMYNPVAKAFDVVNLGDWKTTESTEIINGVSHKYYTYSYTGTDRGSVKLIVNF